MITFLLFLSAAAGLAVSAFCSGMETGFLSVRRERVLHAARAGGVRAKVVFAAISNLGRTTTALLVGNNLANVTYSSAAAALVVALLLLMLGEFLPKLFCSARPLRRTLLLAPYWRIFERVFVPVGALVQRVIERLMPKSEMKPKMTPEAVLKILADRKDGVRLSDFESALIGRIMVLRAKGEFIVPEAVLSALDDKTL